MAATDTVKAPTDDARSRRSALGSGWLGSWWMVGGFALLMLLVLGWQFLADPSLSAPTRDPAWYTWRAQVILEGDPVRVAEEWGPNGLFAGGYRVTVPLAGALLQQVVGIDRYTFSAFLMIGVPILTGLALGAALFRSRRDPLVVLTTLLATVALFLTTPYVGYLDNITVLFLLALTIPFVHEARTSWGARTALFLIGIAAAFTHPTTCVIFGAVLMGVFGLPLPHEPLLLGAALKADAPMLMSVGFGMIAGLAMWVVGIWGKPASLAEAALPPPYTRGVLHRPSRGMGAVAPADRDRAVHRDRDRLDDPAVAAHPGAGPHRGPGLHLVADRVRRRRLGAHRARPCPTTGS